MAALFAWHPLHVESVAWVSERKDVLSTCFGLLALLAYGFYVERPGARRYVPITEYPIGVAGSLRSDSTAFPAFLCSGAKLSWPISRGRYIK